MLTPSPRKVIVHPSQNSIAQVDSEGVVFTHDTLQFQILDPAYKFGAGDASDLIIGKMIDQFNDAAVKLKLHEGRVYIACYLVDDDVIKDTLCRMRKMRGGKAPSDKLLSILRRLTRMAWSSTVCIECFGRQLILHRDRIRAVHPVSLREVFSGSSQQFEDHLVSTMGADGQIELSALYD